MTTHEESQNFPENLEKGISSGNEEILLGLSYANSELLVTTYFRKTAIRKRTLVILY